MANACGNRTSSANNIPIGGDRPSAQKSGEKRFSSFTMKAPAGSFKSSATALSNDGYEKTESRLVYSIVDAATERSGQVMI